MSSETKSTAQFTPGPWQRSGIRAKLRGMSSDFPIQFHTVGQDGDPIAWILYNPKHHVEMLANARLIAAAPDLLQALKDVLAGTYRLEQHEGCTDCNFKRALAAIAKAVKS